MRENKLKNDLILVDKLKNETYIYDIDNAYKIYISLQISTKKEFLLYQMYINVFKKVTYEDINSYGRLLNVEYLNSIVKLKEELINNSKIITFPKLFN